MLTDIASLLSMFGEVLRRHVDTPPDALELRIIEPKHRIWEENTIYRIGKVQSIKK